MYFGYKPKYKTPKKPTAGEIAKRILIRLRYILVCCAGIIIDRFWVVYHYWDYEYGILAGKEASAAALEDMFWFLYCMSGTIVIVALWVALFYNIHIQVRDLIANMKKRYNKKAIREELEKEYVEKMRPMQEAVNQCLGKISEYLSRYPHKELAGQVLACAEGDGCTEGGATTPYKADIHDHGNAQEIKPDITEPPTKSLQDIQPDIAFPELEATGDAGLKTTRESGGPAVVNTEAKYLDESHKPVEESSMPYGESDEPAGNSEPIEEPMDNLGKGNIGEILTKRLKLQPGKYDVKLSFEDEATRKTQSGFITVNRDFDVQKGEAPIISSGEKEPKVKAEEGVADDNTKRKEIMKYFNLIKSMREVQGLTWRQISKHLNQQYQLKTNYSFLYKVWQEETDIK